MQLADIVVGTLPSDACPAQPELWAECIVGATREDDYVRMLRDAGFGSVEMLKQLDDSSASGSAETRKVAGSFSAHTIVLPGEAATNPRR